MENLKLGQKILATTTCMLDNQIFKLEPTTLVDAFETKHQEGLQIRLGEGHWGACPTRSRDCVVTNTDEVDVIFERRCKGLLEKLESGEYKNKLFLIDNKPPYHISILMLSLSDSVNSLKEGNYKVYRGSYASLKVYNDNLGENCFLDIKDALKYYKKKVAEYLVV